MELKEGGVVVGGKRIQERREDICTRKRYGEIEWIKTPSIIHGLQQGVHGT